MKEMDSPNYDGKDKASNKVDDVDDDAIFFKSRTPKKFTLPKTDQTCKAKHFNVLPLAI